MASRRFWLTLLLLGLLAVAGADDSAEDAGEDAGAAEAEDGEEGPLSPSEFAQTVTLFPDFPDNKFVLGELVDVLCGFTNVGDKSFNITAMKGSLHSAVDYQYIQNFTEVSPFSEIKKGEQGTMAFRFLPDPKLDPKDYVLTLSIDYIDADKDEYRTVYFNSTIEIVESQSSLDSRTFFGRFMILAVIGTAVFFGHREYKKRSTKKAYRAAAVSGYKSSDQSEWLQDINAPAGAPRRSGSGKKGSKTKAS